MRRNITLLMEFLDARPEKTRRNYLDVIKEFCQFVRGDRNLDALIGDLVNMTEEELEDVLLDYVAEIKKRNSSMTVHFKLVPLRHLLELYGLQVNWKRIEKIVPKKRTVRRDMPVTRDIVKQVLPLLRPNKRIVIWFLYGTGCRVNEALDLRVKDFDLSADPPRVRVITEKSGIERIVFLPRDLANEINAWITKHRLGPDDLVFFSELGPGHRLSDEKVRKAFQNALRRLGLLKRDASGKGWNYTIHGLRDNYKTVLTNAGVQGLVVEMLMGHDTGLDASYYKPTVEELAREWKKAEMYLRLDYERPEYPEEIKRIIAESVAESELRTLKLIENELIRREILRQAKEVDGKLRPPEKLVFDPETKRLLDQIRKRIRELEKLLPEDRRHKIDRWADELS